MLCTNRWLRAPIRLFDEGENQVRSGWDGRQLPVLYNCPFSDTELLSCLKSRTLYIPFATDSRLVSLLNIPASLALSVVRGFHNAPRLYSDHTVRSAPKLTGFHGSLLAAGSKFAFGMWDGFTGFEMQPIRGAREHGIVESLEGVAKGLGGLLLKPGAAVMALPAYTPQGVRMELNMHCRATYLAYIKAIWSLQGE